MIFNYDNYQTSVARLAGAVRAWPESRTTCARAFAHASHGCSTTHNTMSIATCVHFDRSVVRQPRSLPAAAATDTVLRLSAGLDVRALTDVARLRAAEARPL